MAVVAITGASGFIGRELGSRAIAAGHEVIALDRAALASVNPSSVDRADALVHLAGRAHVLHGPHDDSVAFFEANVLLTQKVFGAAVAAGVKRFIHVSSAGVLGAVSPSGGFTEESPGAPSEEYARSKLQAEEWLRSQTTSRIETVMIRPPMVHGPGARGNFGRLLKITDSNWPLPFGGLRAERSMIGLRNLCDLLMTTVTAPRVPTSPVLVTDGEDIGLRDLVIRLRALQRRKTRLVNVPQAVFSALLCVAGRSREIAKLTQPFVLRPRLAAEVMGWRPPYSLQDELQWATTAEAGPPA